MRSVADPKVDKSTQTDDITTIVSQQADKQSEVLEAQAVERLWRSLIGMAVPLQ